MRKIFRVIDGISEWSGKIVSFVIYAGIIMLVFEVVARYFFNSPTIWAHGYSQRLFGSYFVLIGAYTLLKGFHVRIDLIYQRFSIRIRALLDILNYTMLLLWTTVLVYEGLNFFMYSWSIKETDMSALRHPVYPVKFLLLLGVSLIFLQGLSKFAMSVITLIKGVQYES